MISLISSIGLLLAACIWGFAFVVVKSNLDAVPPIYMLAFRFFIAAVALSLIYIKKIKLLNAKYWKHGIFLGLYLFLAYAFQTVGCIYTTAGKNAFLTTIYVILIPLISWPLTKNRPGWHIFIAAIIALIGIGLLSLQKASSIFDMNFGDFLTIICGFFYAFHILFTSHCNKKQDPILLTVLQFIFATIFSIIVAPFYDGAFPLQAIKNQNVIFSMLYLGVFSTLIAFVLQNVCLKYVNPSLASLFLSMESVFGTIFGVICLGETMNNRLILGCSLMFFAIIFAETKFSFLQISKPNKTK